MALQSAGPISWSALNLAYGFSSNAQLGISQLRCTTSNVGVSNVSMSNFQNTLIPLESNVSYRQLTESVTTFNDNATGNTIFNNNRGSFTYVTNTNVPSADFIGIEWKGKMKLSGSGAHSFILASDDGSELFVNGSSTATAYGIHGASDGPAGTITLNGGVYDFRLRYQEWNGSELMTLKYQPPGTTGHNAISFPTYMCYTFVPYLKFDANDVYYRQGVQATGNIASWSNTGNELSGATNNSNAAASNNPTLQSDAAGYMVRFDRASSQHFRLGNLVFNRFRSDDSLNINGLTVFVVCRFSGTSIGSWERIFDFGMGTNSDNILFTRFSTTFHTNIEIYSTGTTQALSKYMINTADGAFHVYTMVVTNGAPMTLTAYFDGQQIPSNQMIDRFTPTNALNKTSLTSNFLGRSNWGDEYLTGDIREIQIFREVMPTSIVNRFNNYLMFKWGITPMSSSVPPITSGMIGLYYGDNFTAGSQWTDLSGSGNHVTSLTGTPINSSVTLNGFKALSGGTSDGLRWSASILPSTYTLFHVARYNGGITGRIFDGVASNWLSGFHSGKSGVAFHNNWITAQTNLHGLNWVLSTDQNSLYRSNGVNRTNAAPGSPSNNQLSINWGFWSAERSNWAVACVIIYNRTLSASEIVQVECWLNRRYVAYT
jgi:hypothetical protein